MHRNATFSERLEEKLRERGYWNAKRKALEVGRFCVENGYLPSYVYRWLRGEVPRAESLLMLARQIGADPEWLVGLDGPKGPGPGAKRRRPVPIAGGSGASVLAHHRTPPEVEKHIDGGPGAPYQNWRRLWWCLCQRWSPTLAHA